MAKPKLRKMLGSADSPYIISLMRIIETQSKETLTNWCVDYAEKYFLPIYEKAYPEGARPAEMLKLTRDFLDGKIKLPALKKAVADVTAAAKEAADSPAAMAAARAISQAGGVIYTPTHSLGMTFYGAAAIAYDSVGLSETDETYDKIAAEECAKMEAALREIAVPNEPNPAKINWGC